jgi:hypothetical protein
MKFWLTYLAACLFCSFYGNDVQQVIVLIPGFGAIYWIVGLLLDRRGE